MDKNITESPEMENATIFVTSLFNTSLELHVRVLFKVYCRIHDDEDILVISNVT